MRVLFVCSGNICRSPFAEAALRSILTEKGHRGVAVSSAGTLGIRDRPASDAMLRTAREHGLDLHVHRSRPLTGGSLRRADLVVVMERGHRALIEDRWPGEAEKVRLLREYETPDGRGPREDVFDPIGRSPEDYRACNALMIRCVRNLADRLVART